jgi:hypothetical protein
MDGVESVISKTIPTHDANAPDKIIRSITAPPVGTSLPSCSVFFSSLFTFSLSHVSLLRLPFPFACLSFHTPHPCVPSEEEGVSLRAIREVFGRVEGLRRQRPHIKYTLKCSFLQIYQEAVYDLLAAGHVPGSKEHLQRKGLRIRWDRSREFFVENLYV